MKISSTLSIVAIASVLAACGGGGGGDSKTENNPPPTTEKPPANDYPTTVAPSNYSSQDQRDIYDTLNAYRTTCGFGAVKQSSLLDTAATGHAKYLQINNAISHFQVNTNPGFTGVDISDRIAASGYQAFTWGEIASAGFGGSAIAGTSPSGIETPVNAPSGKSRINRLFASVYHLGLATGEWNDLGVGYSASGNSSSIPGQKQYYVTAVVNFGIPLGTSAPKYSGGKIRSFPCDGISGVSPIFTAELPSPYPSRDFNQSPMGAPIFLTSASGEMSISSAEMVNLASGASVVTKILQSTDDVNKLVGINQAFIIPDQPLVENTQYRVTVNGVSDTQKFTKVITFRTGTQN